MTTQNTSKKQFELCGLKNISRHCLQTTLFLRNKTYDRQIRDFVVFKQFRPGNNRNSHNFIPDSVLKRTVSCDIQVLKHQI